MARPQARNPTFSAIEKPSLEGFSFFVGFDRLPKDDFAFLEKGLKQRVMALNLFIQDIYGEKQIIRDRVVPEEFVYASSGYLAQCEGVQPPKGVYTHIAGIDLVQGKDGSWYILEDNLRVPSGASYPMIARDLCRRSSPETFRQYQIEDNRNYAQLLRKRTCPMCSTTSTSSCSRMWPRRAATAWSSAAR